MGQQRTQNNRGSVQKPNQRPVADIAWHITSVVGAVVELELDAAPDRLVLQSSPSFTGDDPPQSATSATLVGTVLTLTFPAGPQPGSMIGLASTMPGVRSNIGAYLAAGRQVTPAPVVPPPATPTVPWSLSAPTGATVDIIFNISPNIYCAVALDQFSAPSLNYPTAVAISVTQSGITLTFLETVPSGAIINVSPLALTNGAAGLSVLETGAQVVP